MARKKQTARQKANGVVGCGLLLVLLVVGVQFLPDFIQRWNSEPFTRPTRTPHPNAFTSVPSARTTRVSSTIGRTNTPAPSATIDLLMMTREGIEFYGVTFEPSFDFLIAQGDFDLHDCPQFGCDVVGTVEIGKRITVAGGVVGESMEGFEGWIIFEDDGRLSYAHLYQVLPMEATAQAYQTASPTPNESDYGQRIDTAEEWIVLTNDVDFRSCPLLSCDVVREAQKDERVLGVGIISGEIANDISFSIWAIVRFDDVELFAPMSDVFPPDEGE